MCNSVCVLLSWQGLEVAVQLSSIFRLLPHSVQSWNGRDVTQRVAIQLPAVSAIPDCP